MPVRRAERAPSQQEGTKLELGALNSAWEESENVCPDIVPSCSFFCLNNWCQINSCTFFASINKHKNLPSTDSTLPKAFRKAAGYFLKAQYLGWERRMGRELIRADSWHALRSRMNPPFHLFLHRDWKSPPEWEMRRTLGERRNLFRAASVKRMRGGCQKSIKEFGAEMEKEKRREKMVEKKAKTYRREGGGRQAVFRGRFVLQKLSTRLQCAFHPPPYLLGCAHKGAGKQSRRSCRRFTSTQNRGALRERKLPSDPCTTNHDGNSYRPKDSRESAGRKPAESSLFLQRS